MAHDRLFILKGALDILILKAELGTDAWLRRLVLDRHVTEDVFDLQEERAVSALPSTRARSGSSQSGACLTTTGAPSDTS